MGKRSFILSRKDAAGQGKVRVAIAAVSEKRQQILSREIARVMLELERMSGLQG
jgi:hypothetical protein